MITEEEFDKRKDKKVLTTTKIGSESFFTFVVSILICVLIFFVTRYFVSPYLLPVHLMIFDFVLPCFTVIMYCIIKFSNQDEEVMAQNKNNTPDKSNSMSKVGS